MIEEQQSEKTLLYVDLMEEEEIGEPRMGKKVLREIASFITFLIHFYEPACSKQ